MKEVRWLSNSCSVVRGFPTSARLKLGYELTRLQLSAGPKYGKRLPQVGRGVHEIRIVDKKKVFRVIYVASIGTQILVMQAEYWDAETSFQIGQYGVALPSDGAMSKNVFLDLGFSKSEAAALQARVSLAVEIERYIKGHSMTNAKAAAAFGVSQAIISKLMRGSLSHMSLEYLLKMLARVGIAIRMVPSPRKSTKRSVIA